MSLHGKGKVARELFVVLLHEKGPMTNRELADAAREASEDHVWLHGWSIHAHMVKLEKEGRVTRVQLGKGTVIMWVAAEESS